MSSREDDKCHISTIVEIIRRCLLAALFMRTALIWLLPVTFSGVRPTVWVMEARRKIETAC
jgi:hypothetical protein